MTLHVGSDKIENIHFYNDRIYRVYEGSTLIWRAYKTNEVVFESGYSGQYSLNLIMNGIYRITMVGGGAGGAFNSSDNRGSQAAGNSGGLYVLTAKLGPGNYTINVGAGGAFNGGLDYDTWGGNGGDTSIVLNNTTLMSAGGGTGNHAWWPSGAELNSIPSAYNTLNSSIMVISTTSNLSGNWGQISGSGGVTSIGGTSLYNGYGKGGNCYNRYSAENGTGGYIKIEFLGEYKKDKFFTYTINPTPSDATVTLSANGVSQVGNSITVYQGTILSWTVSKSGYQTQSGIKTINSTVSDNIVLQEGPMYYCYTSNGSYIYMTRKPSSAGETIPSKTKSLTNWSLATDISQLEYDMNVIVGTIVNENAFTWGNNQFSYYSAGDLYG